MGGLSWRGLVIPKYSAPPSGETMHQIRKSFQGARTCSRSSITMPSLVGLGFHSPPGQPKTLSFFCLSVCLFVCSSRFWTSEVVRQISPWRRWSTETILIPLDRGRFVVVHRVQLSQIAANWRYHKMPKSKNGKIWGIFAARERLNKSIETKFGT